MTRRVSRCCAAAALVSLLGAASPVLAAEMLVHGEVVDVVPLPSMASAACRAAHPAAGAGLVALLEWDLRSACPPPPVASGYRVYYRWDGRTYSRVMAERPGATVSLRVRLR